MQPYSFPNLWSLILFLAILFGISIPYAVYYWKKIRFKKYVNPEKKPELKIQKTTHLDMEIFHRRAHCDSCGKITIQETTLHNPDIPDSLIGWRCRNCFEMLEIQTN